MATVAIRSGVRRLVATSAKSGIHAVAEASPAAAALQIKAGAPNTAVSKGLPYAPRVDPLNPGVLLRRAASTGRAMPSVGPQVQAADTRNTGVQVRGLASTGRRTPSLEQQPADLTSDVIHLPSAASIGRGATTLDQQVQTQAQAQRPALLASDLGASTLVRRIAPAYHGSSSSKASAGAYTSSRHPYASRASPFGSSSAKQVIIWSTPNKFGLRQFSADASDKAKADVCKCNGEAVLKTLDEIQTKVGEIDDKVNQIGDKLDKNGEDSTNLEKDVRELKVKDKGSGDWTSFKFKGKTINWLSVGSAAWEAFKALTK